ncbi:MAG: Gfo/Idh/MocA family oxidoreductase [Micavibrio aeruginosavorus]|uniref:Gfo/Idh/MocA family oxidoreductase n=1 Tax=Micavibrio aeruginosavorus TaxID=349221 RepID=A0A7T5R2F9_9BACT|nr:MAG: Gfo/Idh/MocA family oxidoreductase [Micavibrio aeruginosavorus]
MTNRPALKAAVIGGGLMGVLMDTPENVPPLTHAGGFLQHPDYDLKAICEPHPSPSLQNWPCKLYTALDDLLREEKLDIVSIAVPKEQQPSILTQLLDSGLQAVIAEKPLAPTLAEACALRDLYQEAGIPLLVNLPRRYSLMYQDFAKKFRTGEEHALCATLYYGKGLIHNGIHGIDLARLLFGEVIEARPLFARPDVFAEDPSISAFLRLEHCSQFHLNALDDNRFTCFELDIITDSGRYIVTNDHRTLQTSAVCDHTGIPLGKRLISTGSRPTDYEQSIMFLLDNARDVIGGKAAPLCSAATICDSHAVIQQIRDKARGNYFV